MPKVASKKTTRNTTATAKPATRRGRKPATPPQDSAELAANAGIANALTGGDFRSFLTDLKALADRYLAGAGTADIVSDDAPAPQTRDERETELMEMTVRQIRNALIAAKDADGDEVFDAADIKAESDKKTLVQNLLDFEFDTLPESDDDEDDENDSDEEDDSDDDEGDEEESDEEDDDEDSEDDDESDDEDEEVDRDSLLKLSLANLKKMATDQYEIPASKVKGKDRDAIADMILEAAGSDDDESDDEEDGEDEFWTYDELMDLPIAEVRGIADEAGIKYSAAESKSKAKLAKKIAE